MRDTYPWHPPTTPYDAAANSIRRLPAKPAQPQASQAMQLSKPDSSRLSRLPALCTVLPETTPAPRSQPDKGSKHTQVVRAVQHIQACLPNRLTIWDTAASVHTPAMQFAQAAAQAGVVPTTCCCGLQPACGYLSRRRRGNHKGRCQPEPSKWAPVKQPQAPAAQRTCKRNRRQLSGVTQQAHSSAGAPLTA